MPSCTRIDHNRLGTVLSWQLVRDWHIEYDPTRNLWNNIWFNMYSSWTTNWLKRDSSTWSKEGCHLQFCSAYMIHPTSLLPCQHPSANVWVNTHLQVLLGTCLLIYVPNLELYPDYIPLSGDSTDDPKNEKLLGEHVCPERYANIFSSKCWIYSSVRSDKWIIKFHHALLLQSCTLVGWCPSWNKAIEDPSQKKMSGNWTSGIKLRHWVKSWYLSIIYEDIDMYRQPYY